MPILPILPILCVREKSDLMNILWCLAVTALARNKRYRLFSFHSEDLKFFRNDTKLAMPRTKAYIGNSKIISVKKDTSSGD